MPGPDSTTARPAATLVELFHARCAEGGAAPAVSWVADDLSITEQLSFEDLHRQSLTLAQRLAAFGRPGDRVLLALRPGLDFVRAFWACMLAGRVAVPVPALDAARLQRGLPRLQGIARDAAAALGLCDAAAFPAMQDGFGAGGMPWHAPQALAGDARTAALPAVEAGALAYLQYTSGSTAEPRGACLTHAQVLANLEMLGAGFGISRGTRVLNWLPHFHDYGLVSGILLPLAHGAPTWLMSPLTFLRRPLRWLDAIDAFAITLTGGPDSAYAACLRHQADAGWSGRLDSLVSLTCGAEPIRASTAERLLQAFGASGLRPGAFAPAYGLAESVLGVSASPLGAPARSLRLDGAALHRHEVVPAPASAAAADVRSIVSCGPALRGVTLRIVEPDTGVACPPGRVGEIWVRSAAVGAGYWGRPAESAATFQARGADGAGPFLRTGDLGFVDGGELFVTGRLKDLLIVHGQNLYPQDIEWTAEQAHPQLRTGGYACAFAVDAPEGDAAVVLVEARGRPSSSEEQLAILRAVRRAVAQTHELPVHAVALMRGGALPRTSSGKIQRRRCRQAWLDGTLAPLAVLHDEAGEGAEDGAPADAIEHALWQLWAEVLGRDGFDTHTHFIELGGTSLLLTQVASRIQHRWGVQLPWEVLLDEPTVARLAQQLRQRLPEAAPDAVAPPAASRAAPLPASLSQRRMWLVQQFDPHSVAYNVALSLRLRGPLAPARLVGALELLVQRHESLRTRLTLQQGQVMQVVEPSAALPFERIDLGGTPPGEREAAARALLSERAATPFDLRQAPLHRATLVRLADDDHVFLWSQHHAITDNWSMTVLVRELLLCEAAWAAGRSPQLPPLPVQYADHAVHQHAPAQVERRAAQRSHWVARLAGLQPLMLPTDFARPVRPGFRGSKVSAPLTPALRAAVQAAAVRAQATPFVVLLAAFQLLLSRQSGVVDVAVGVPVANRHALAAESLVGTLVNTLVLRTDLSDDPAVGELLQRVRRTALDAFAHQDMPFDELVEALGQDRARQPNGLVRVLFNVVNAPLGPLPAVPWRYEEFELDRTAAQFDLSLHVDTEFGHRIHIEYATELFLPATAQRLLDNYLTLLHGLLQAGESLPISALDGVSSAEQALVAGWQGRDLPLPARPLVHHHLDIGARARRDEVALVDAHGRQLRFGELEAQSNALARLLRRHGIARGQRVGLCGPRDVHMVVAMLGVLKAGAAYVPLDPAFPAERLAHMVADAQPAALVSAGASAAAPDWAPGVPLIDIASPAFLALGDTAPLPIDPALDAGPEDAAYLIYTSGSTGRPKGVAVPHRAVVNFLAGMAHTPGLQAGDRLLAVTTLSFDIAVLELLLPLAVGAQAVIASREQVQDPRQLARLLERHEITVMQATPSAWRALLDSGWTGGPAFRALVGGEPLPATLAERLLACCGALWNMYGPTETTVWSTCWRVRDARAGISIGRPIANTQVHVLDAQGRPCPVGVPGEAFIGGAGVALGYHGRDALTAERFVPDPFGGLPGARLYRTGDRCRWRHDGQLEHLGRMDHQVKVRGFRIELGEIESVLQEHAAVAQCVVVTRSERDDDVRLVAYAVLRGGSPADAAALREHLRLRLPEYMVPQHIVSLPALPLLPNGKIDRGSLPAPSPAPAEGGGRTRAAPATEDEAAVAAIWRELLGVDDVRPGDNFFDLGGHSLLAMRAVLAMEERLGWRVAPRRLVFETMRQIARPESTQPA
ncbi:amino acid adenylation domain-containing protein [Xenophilus aerolatus]|nr:amino acid adenylation domain-containing protein [Xenophilus aerolatus]